MKKRRLLALALCLVLAMSLLPITAAADSWTDPKTGIGVQGIEPCGTYHGDTYFSVVLPMGASIYGEVIGYTGSGTPQNLPKESDGRYKIPEDSQIVKIYFVVAFGPVPPLRYYIPLNHDWQFTQTDSNTLTAACQRNDIAPMSVELKADSVTLPESPFQAQLVGLEQFQEKVPDAVIGAFVYKYKGPNGWNIVEPTAANAKAGEYQVGVRITIPTSNANGQDQVFDLYVKYTAADPKVTAQTGDNRPIEIMMASVLVFSALAAAAFILDSKRKYKQ